MDGFSGFSIAKRKMVESIDSRLEMLKRERLDKKTPSEGVPHLDDFRVLQARILELESMRNYIRNVLLWKTE